MKHTKLKKLKKFKGRKGPLVLIIMDGIGVRKESDQNALLEANTPFLDYLKKIGLEKNLYIELLAHGTWVGLPTNDLMGNSEVAHNAIGSGRVVKQRATIAKEMIKSGNLFKGIQWKKFISNITKNNSTAHFIGLLSDGYVHSYISHLFVLLKGIQQQNIEKVRIHALLDGRDVPPQSALKYINQLQKKLNKINKEGNFDYRIASGGGRMRVTMDRYNSDWNVVKRGWEAHVCGIPEIHDNYQGYFHSAEEAIQQARKIDPDINDQYLPSFVIVDQNRKPIGKMKNYDGVINFNFRGDRTIEISRAFDEDDFNEFDKICNPNVFYFGLFLYDDKLNIPKNYFLEPPQIEDTITTYLCKEKIQQFSIAETHKFGHIKYFFLGNRDKSPCPELDKYFEIKSDPSELIEKNPEMKAYQVKDKLIEILNSNKFKFIRVNFANGDMVGHTGNFQSAKIAAKTVDHCVKEIVNKTNELDGITIVMADHGNLEDMKNYETSHTLNPVMFTIVDSDYNKEYIIDTSVQEPCIANVAATIFNLLGFEKPESYLRSLIKFL